MTYDQYWFEDPWIAKTFREADKLRQERTNETAWLHGAYVAMAISATIGNAFVREGSKKAEYPEKPIDLSKVPEEPDEEAEALFAKIYMNNMVRAGRNWGKKQGGA